MSPKTQFLKNNYGSNDSPTPDFSWKKMISSFWWFLGSNKKKFVFWMSVLSLMYLYDLLPPVLIAKVIDFFTTYTKQESLKPFYIIVFSLTATYAIASIIRLNSKRLLGQIRQDLKYNIRVEGYQKLLKNSLRWHDSENTGNKIQRISAGSAAIKDFQSLLYQELIKLVITFVSVITVFFVISPKYGLFLLIHLTLFFLIQWAFTKRIKVLINQSNKAQELSSGKYYEGLNNILSLKSLGATHSLSRIVNKTENQAKYYSYKISALGSYKWQLFQVLNSVGYGLFLLMVGLDIVSGTLSVGVILIYWTYFNKVIGGAGDSTDYIDQLIEMKQAVARMMPIFENKNDFIKFGTRKFPKDWDTIEAKELRFNYKETKVKGTERPSALNGVNLSISKNQKVGIAGRSGSGKSTFAKILIGLYQFKEGEIRIGGIDLYDIKEEEITKNIAIVLQESELFNLSLLENITLLQKTDAEMLAKAIFISGLEEVIKDLPDGLNTMIGEKGYHLSGGQRQRVGIARAIFKDAQIIIFDEATSNLDIKTESEIQKRLEENLADKTMITIAHRVSTLENSDIIHVFKDGKIEESGKFEELVNRNGEFARIIKMKRGS